MINPERAAEIERNPDLFYNHEKFRIWQTKAYIRATFTSLIAVPAGFTLANGGKNGVGLMRVRPGVSALIVIATWFSSFYIWHRIVGYSNQAYNE